MIEALSVVLQDVMQANVNTEHLHQYKRLQQANLAQNMYGSDSASVFADIHRLRCANVGISGITGNFGAGPQVMANVPTKFDSAYAPAVSLEQYLSRIHTYAKCSDSCFVVALIYIDRIIAMHSFRVTALNAHRIFLASILLSAKFLDDIYYNNSFFAKLGGISLQELNALELEVLRLTRFDLNVSEEQYGAYHASIRSYVRRTPSPAPLISHNNDGLYSHNLPNLSNVSCGNACLLAEMDMQWQQQIQQVVPRAYAYTSPVPMQANHNHVHVVTPPYSTARVYNTDCAPDVYGDSNAVMQHSIGYVESVDGTFDADGNFVQGTHEQQFQQQQLQPPQLQLQQQQKLQQLLPNGLQAQQWWEEGQGQVHQVSHTDATLQPPSYKWRHHGAGGGYGYDDPTCVYPALPMYPLWRSAVAATI